jgi:UTP--glucose-1-phosphate uridylyltransferase
MYQSKHNGGISRHSFRAQSLAAKQPAIARPHTVQNPEYFPSGPYYLYRREIFPIFGPSATGKTRGKNAKFPRLGKPPLPPPHFRPFLASASQKSPFLRRPAPAAMASKRKIAQPTTHLRPSFTSASQNLPSLRARDKLQFGFRTTVCHSSHPSPEVSTESRYMNIRKAVVTAAAPQQRTLALQTLIDRDGHEKSILRIIVEEIRRANVDQIAIVIAPGDEAAYTRAVADRTVQFIHQGDAAGYAHALYSARSFVHDEGFLHLVGDHIYVGADGRNDSKRLVKMAAEEGCSISAVQATRETLLGHYGTIGGQRLHGKPGLYKVEKVLEKPTPTEAEQSLSVSGMRAGHYLCFFGMHVLTPTFMELLEQRMVDKKAATVSGILNELAQREQYLALETKSRRYDVGVKYGLFQAQLALALSGEDRDTVLAQLVEHLALGKSEAAE